MRLKRKKVTSFQVLVFQVSCYIYLQQIVFKVVTRLACLLGYLKIYTSVLTMKKIQRTYTHMAL